MITFSTTIDQVETNEGLTTFRMVKRKLNDGVVVEEGFHRSSVERIEQLDDMMIQVNRHLVQMGWAECTDYQIVRDVFAAAAEVPDAHTTINVERGIVRFRGKMTGTALDTITICDRQKLAGKALHDIAFPPQVCAAYDAKLAAEAEEKRIAEERAALEDAARAEAAAKAEAARAAAEQKRIDDAVQRALQAARA